MAVCGFYTTVFPEKARLGNPILHSPPRLCRPASVLRTAEPFSGLIKTKKARNLLLYREISCFFIADFQILPIFMED